MHDLKKFNRYAEEIAAFKQKADKIKIPETRRKVESLLKELDQQISIINDAHSPTRSGGAKPKSVHENIANTARIRWQLKSLLRV